MASRKSDFRSGFVSILGLPNVGKSTLLNSLIGTKVAIVADKPQTTRTAVQGVWSGRTGQIVFLDTPGIHRADTTFNKRMMSEVRAALDQRDLLLYVADGTREPGEEDKQAFGLLRKAETPVVLAINKIDRVREKARLLPVLDAWRDIHEFVDYVPVSALRGHGVDELREAILQRLPKGERWFPPDHVTDQPERFLAAELIREKIIRATRNEVPHSTAVMIDQWEEARKLTRVTATIYVERPGQKKIVIGAGGAMLREIGTAAREEMEALFGRKFFLELFVKVMERWRERESFLAELDWRTMMESGTER